MKHALAEYPFCSCRENDVKHPQLEAVNPREDWRVAAIGVPRTRSGPAGRFRKHLV